MGEPPNPEILSPRKATHPPQTRGGAGGGEGGGQGPGTPRGAQGCSAKCRKRSPPPHPRSRNTPVPSQHSPTEGAAGRTAEIPRAPAPREVLGCYLSTPKAAPPLARPLAARREGSAGGCDAKSGSPRRWAPTKRVEPGASPRSADRRRGWGVAVTGVPVSGVPTATAKCSALPLPAPITRDQRGKIRRGTLALRPPPPGTPIPPGTGASGPPTPASPPPETPTSFVNSPARPAPPSGDPEDHAPPASRRVPLESRGRTCARRRRSPAPLGSAGAAPNPTHIATHSPLTSPSPRPAHVTAETHGFPQTPPPSPAARGRARAAGGGGRARAAEGGRGGEGRGTEPAAAPRARARGPAAATSRLPAPRGRARRLAYCGSRGLPRPVVWRARPSPPGARPAFPAPRAVWAAGARRFAQPAVWGRHRPAPAPPAARWRRARPGGALAARPPRCKERGGRAAARCTVRDPSSRRGGGRARPAERHRPRSGTGDPPPAGPQLGCPAPEAAGWQPPSRAPGVGPARGGCLPPPRGLPPEGRPASCRRSAALRPTPAAPASPGRPPPRRLPRADLLRHRAGPEGWPEFRQNPEKTFSSPLLGLPPPTPHPLSRLLSRFQKGGRNYMFLQCFLRGLGFCFGSAQEMRRGKRRLKSFRL
ncbi:basic proline-rich protein-like [Hippopotamus amphibius kiboko]|uniref:basic proline-rich protein-like n=1 Tax=Hippopotamus amphibius kiboko TaxID=575201 RepID=UPI002596BB3A|nr:basic proline-rich protein-like [Hippopotamus amphibius kiboko]